MKLEDVCDFRHILIGKTEGKISFVDHKGCKSQAHWMHDNEHQSSLLKSSFFNMGFKRSKEIGIAVSTTTRHIKYNLTHTAG